MWVAGRTVRLPCYTWAISERFGDKELIYKALYKFRCLQLFYHDDASVKVHWFTQIGLKSYATALHELLLLCTLEMCQIHLWLRLSPDFAVEGGSTSQLGSRVKR